MRIFNHPLFPEYAGKYRVYADRVVGKRGVLKFHLLKTGAVFLRLSPDLSVCFAKLLLLTFRGAGYSHGLIAVHLDGDVINNSLRNLKWGTRKDQSAIAMKNKDKFKRVQEMGLKYGKLTNHSPALERWRQANGKSISEDTKARIRLLKKRGHSNRTIAEILHIGTKSVAKYLN